MTDKRVRTPVDHARPTIASIVKHAALLYRARLILRREGFQAALNWAMGAGLDSSTAAASSTAPSVIARSVAIAAAFAPGRFRCLEQSLVLYHSLRSHGHAADLRIGATSYRFRAHAWVEVAGAPLNELPERVRLYRAFDLPRHA